MENRNFKLDTEWNMIHYSEKPNGFGILIIGDERHFVDEQKSFWTQNEGKHQLISRLREKGYTIFYSNLYGKNWGSQKAVWMAERLYHYIMRSEILNPKIHVIAEGMGALVALQLLKNMESAIRSIVLLNPILSLQNHLEHEKEHKFFYKKVIHEISQAYELDTKTVADTIAVMDELERIIPVQPVKVIQILSGKKAYQQSEFLQRFLLRWKANNENIFSSYILPEKTFQLGRMIHVFFQQYEEEL